MQPLQLDPQPPSDPFQVLKATGELDIHTQDEFERIVTELLGTSSVVVDLSDLDFLAISALRSLIVCHRLAGTVGHELFFAGPPRQTRRLLTVSGLDTVLPLAPSVAKAVGGSAARASAAGGSAAGGSADGASAVDDGVPDQTFRNLAQLDVG